MRPCRPTSRRPDAGKKLAPTSRFSGSWTKGGYFAGRRVPVVEVFVVPVRPEAVRRGVLVPGVVEGVDARVQLFLCRRGGRRVCSWRRGRRRGRRELGHLWSQRLTDEHADCKAGRDVCEGWNAFRLLTALLAAARFVDWQHGCLRAAAVHLERCQPLRSHWRWLYLYCWPIST